VDYDEAVATQTNLDRGFSAQVGLEVTLEYISDETSKERARSESQNQRTYSESLSINKTTARSPPNGFESMKLALATYAGLLCGFFTETCPLYNDVMGLRAAMDLPQVSQKKGAYTAKVCLTHWYNVLNQSRAFFYSKADENDFNGSVPTYPQSLLSQALPSFLAGQPIEDATFPVQWYKLITSGSAARAGRDPFAGGRIQADWGNPTNQRDTVEDISQKLAHCHITIREEFKEYHQAFGGAVVLTKLLDSSNMTISDLPYLTAYGRGSNNRLCYSYIMGICGNPTCKRVHIDKDHLHPPFLRELCDKTKAGRS